MRTITIVYSEEAGEVEGAFDEQETLLDYWWTIAATWRGEYFNGLFEQLGIEILGLGDVEDDVYERLVEKLNFRVKKDLGDDEDDNDDEE